MRLIKRSNDLKSLQQFSLYLRERGIQNELDVEVVKDWGSDEYGDQKASLWIIDEEQTKKAHAYLKEFEENPSDPKFQKEIEPKTVKKPTAKIVQPPPPANENGVITFSIIFICTLLYIVCFFTDDTKKDELSGCPFKLELIFDTNKNWGGFYTKVIDRLKGNEDALTVHQELFTKIREGQVWRLFTPALLHARNPFHLFFNMLWLLVVGRQMEERIGAIKYLLFIFFTAIVANIAQYLMSGPAFLGFSGVICAMITFVWFRQKWAPWEGYQLLPSTMGFITLFVLGLGLVQLASIYTEVVHNIPIATGIANTAHLTGAFLGYLLAYPKFFSAR